MDGGVVVRPGGVRRWNGIELERRERRDPTLRDPVAGKRYAGQRIDDSQRNIGEVSAQPCRIRHGRELRLAAALVESLVRAEDERFLPDDGTTRREAVLIPPVRRIR